MLIYVSFSTLINFTFGIFMDFINNYLVQPVVGAAFGVLGSGVVNTVLDHATSCFSRSTQDWIVCSVYDAALTIFDYNEPISPELTGMKVAMLVTGLLASTKRSTSIHFRGREVPLPVNIQMIKGKSVITALVAGIVTYSVVSTIPVLNNFAFFAAYGISSSVSEEMFHYELAELEIDPRIINRNGAA